MVIEHGAVATELIGHITKAGATQAAERLCDATAITAQHLADITVFDVTGPRRLKANDIIVLPKAQVG
ncbi:MAG: hypothetical protein ABSA14_02440 [Acidimicrobiales bacterium]|jgi:NADP-dependent 3-hydroxy acid dehydrogenase YdfG